MWVCVGGGTYPTTCKNVSSQRVGIQLSQVNEVLLYMLYYHYDKTLLQYFDANPASFQWLLLAEAWNSMNEYSPFWQIFLLMYDLLQIVTGRDFPHKCLDLWGSTRCPVPGHGHHQWPQPNRPIRNYKFCSIQFKSIINSLHLFQLWLFCNASTFCEAFAWNYEK